MNIDITPKIAVANEIDSIVMDLYGYRAMYVICTSDGNNHSVKWNDKTLKEFQPNKNVSTVLSDLYDDIHSRINLYTKALNDNAHPYRKIRHKIMRDGIIGPVWTGEYEEVPEQMTKYCRQYYEREIINLSKISGKPTLVKIVRNQQHHPGIYQYPHVAITVGSKWITRHGWGDVDDLYITQDVDKTTVFTVKDVSDTDVLFTIDYDGNRTPGKVFSNTIDEFLNDLKPKPDERP